MMYPTTGGETDVIITNCYFILNIYDNLLVFYFTLHNFATSKVISYRKVKRHEQQIVYF